MDQEDTTYVDGVLVQKLPYMGEQAVEKLKKDKLAEKSSKPPAWGIGKGTSKTKRKVPFDADRGYNWD